MALRKFRFLKGWGVPIAPDPVISPPFSYGAKTSYSYNDSPDVFKMDGIKQATPQELRIFYGIPFNRSATVPDLMNILEKALKAGKCAALAPSIAADKMFAEIVGGYAKEGNTDPPRFVAKYFLDGQGRPNKEKTKEPLSFSSRRRCTKGIENEIARLESFYKKNEEIHSAQANVDLKLFLKRRLGIDLDDMATAPNPRPSAPITLDRARRERRDIPEEIMSRASGIPMEEVYPRAIIGWDAANVAAETTRLRDEIRRCEEEAEARERAVQEKTEAERKARWDRQLKGHYKLVAKAQGRPRPLSLQHLPGLYLVRWDGGTEEAWSHNNHDDDSNLMRINIFPPESCYGAKVYFNFRFIEGIRLLGMSKRSVELLREEQPKHSEYSEPEISDDDDDGGGRDSTGNRLQAKLTGEKRSLGDIADPWGVQAARAKRQMLTGLKEEAAHANRVSFQFVCNEVDAYPLDDDENKHIGYLDFDNTGLTTKGAFDLHEYGKKAEPISIFKVSEEPERGRELRRWYSTSTFLSSSIPVAHNAVKSIIFRCAELLMGLFIFKFASLAAARSGQFTSYLMFAEDHIQRFLFMKSRGLSRGAVLVFLYTMLHLAASLYGTLLWALDSPGYIFRASHSTLAEHQYARNPDAPYVVQLQLDRNTLNQANKSLHQNVGADLFKPGLNISLAGDANRGTREVTAATQSKGVGARIWLDEEGFSVSADSLVAWPSAGVMDGHEFPLGCIVFDEGVGVWNCTFHNAFANDLVEGILGRPEVHWDDKSSFNDSQYIRPNRVDNVWASYGRGGGTAVMMQVFTVTKGTRRHTFVETFFRATMLTNPGVMFVPAEVDDLVRRAAGTNATERAHPLLGRIIGDILSAQKQRMSYNFGFTVADNQNNTVIQNSWSYYTPVVQDDGSEIFSLLHITSTNITLIRSEDIKSSPGPLRECDQPFMNEAYGGKVTQTNCAGGTLSTEGARFYGTVDTAAVMILYGLGDGRSNASAASMDQQVMEWVWDNLPTMLDLLVARAFAVSVDPALVGVTVQHLIAAMSGLQLFLSVLAAVLALAALGALTRWADYGWSKSFLQSVVHTTLYRGTAESNGFYMKVPPHVDIVVHGEGNYVVIDGRPVYLLEPPVTPAVPAYYQYFQAEPPKEAMAPAVTTTSMVGWGSQEYQYAPVPH
ncbi:uncharacterized protein B0T15DRAFT_490355 [Chaetomium strumarium]|uniref:Uncharacterized protein n=1 Tax=Chaetomium strumarium TaxID=1170767 RepID=A0AAJ0GX31_9PEZI|nr:hypothetical protein B0T15DRAFT_490355 [Chaetomium strumarium]